MNKIAILIPCYNESLTIQKVIKDYKKVLPEAYIYVYDNNSVDHTDLMRLHRRLVLLSDMNIGRGKGMLSGQCSEILMQIVI